MPCVITIYSGPCRIHNFACGHGTYMIYLWTYRIHKAFCVAYMTPPADDAAYMTSSADDAVYITRISTNSPRNKKASTTYP